VGGLSNSDRFVEFVNDTLKDMDICSGYKKKDESHDPRIIQAKIEKLEL